MPADNGWKTQIIQDDVILRTLDNSYIENLSYDIELGTDVSPHTYKVIVTNLTTNKIKEKTLDNIYPLIISATYDGQSILNGSTVNVEKYSGIEALVVSNKGTLSQDPTFSNTTSQTIIYTATDGSFTSTFSIVYNVVDSITPTTNISYVVNDLTVTLSIDDISEDNTTIEIYELKDGSLNLLGTLTNTIERNRTFVVTLEEYGTVQLRVRLMYCTSTWLHGTQRSCTRAHRAHVFPAREETESSDALSPINAPTHRGGSPRPPRFKR
jgi:hypothetical protein